MKEILIFAGTTEGRKLSECLAASKIAHTICVATEYGELVLQENSLVKIQQGRMNQDEIRKFVQDGNFGAVVDATHPYATMVTRNIKQALEGLEVPYFRLLRKIEVANGQAGIVYFETSQACADALQETEGNILLTTGSKELAIYCASEEVKKRLYVRVLPGIESITACEKQGICGKQILALQGPFGVEMNEAILRQYGISCLVTKESGAAGGYQEKVEAAKRVGIPMFVIGRPKENEGYSFEELCKELQLCCNMILVAEQKMEIVLAGIGMGGRECLTIEVEEAIRQADILLGAERMLQPYTPRIEKRPYYLAKQIIPYLKEVQTKNEFMEARKVVILFSGDSGFYSGCQSLYQALKQEIETGKLQAKLRILPGISSTAYLASCIGESYQDAAIHSMHGKELPNLIHKIKTEEKLYLLMSGVKDINCLGALLVEADMEVCEIAVGYQLSYPEQRVDWYTPKECCALTKEGLYTCFIRNPYAVSRRLTHGRADEEFNRAKVPMTKEEVREVSICKLRLQKDSVVYDIGSGTGSIAIEIAGLSDEIQVYALEQKEEAIDLIKENQQKFQLENISVIQTKAPDGLEDLPKATHAFIGGSGGRLHEILDALYRINHDMRVVINAISMETICEIKEALSRYTIKDEEVVQLQVSRSKKVGNYHLMQAENPVWICAFSFVRQRN